MWSSVLGCVLASFVIFPSTGCLATDQGPDIHTNESVKVNGDFPSGGDLIEIDSYELVEERLERDVKAASKKLGLTTLQNNTLSRDFEFRIWSNQGGLGDPKVFGVRFSEVDSDAYFFDMDRKVDSIKLRREQLASPKSGWNKMLFDVRSRLTTPKGLVRDPNFDLGRDEPVILLEVFDKGEYRRVFYGQRTSFPDGKRLIQVCDYLASEFDVDINCRGVDGTP